MKVSVYTKSATDDRIQGVLRAFANGIRSLGHDVIVVEDYKFKRSDCAVFFGSWKQRPDAHHKLKNEIVYNTDQFIVLETPLIGRMPVEEVMKDTWFRVGKNGFLANTGWFNHRNKPSDRWKMIQQSIPQVSKKKYRLNKDGHILIALQLPGDASLQGEKIERWMIKTVMEIRKQTRRPIVIRTPQLNRAYDRVEMNMLKHIPNIIIQRGTADNLVSTLEDSFCAITYSSGLAVDSLINGCPTIAVSKASFAYDITSNKLSNIEFINGDEVFSSMIPSRKQWLNDLAYTQWNVEELERGLPWIHLMENTRGMG